MGIAFDLEAGAPSDKVAEPAQKLHQYRHRVRLGIRAYGFHHLAGEAVIRLFGQYGPLISRERKLRILLRPRQQIIYRSTGHQEIVHSLFGAVLDIGEVDYTDHGPPPYQ